MSDARAVSPRERFWAPSRRLRMIVGAALVVLWIGTTVVGIVRHGLFTLPGPGPDFGNMWVQSEAFLAGRLDELYTVGGRQEQVREFAEWTKAVPSDPSPHPPLWPWLFVPFTLPPPPIGFALWTVVNLLAALWLLRRIVPLFPRAAAWWVAIVAVTAFPIGFSIYLGQTQLLLAVAIGECFLALRAGQELRAGAWLSILILKPQYALLLGFLLLWKRRWRAVAGSAAGIAVILGASAIVTSPRTLIDWPSAWNADRGFRADAPEHMINWRADVLRLWPSVGDSIGTVLVIVLSLATVACIAFVWRGAWDRTDPRFTLRFVMLLVGTLLVNWHGHGYGAAILAIPLAVLLAQTPLRDLTRLAVAATIVLPTLALSVGVLPGSGITAPAIVLSVGVIVTFGALLYEYHADAPAADGPSSRSPASSVVKSSSNVGY